MMRLVFVLFSALGIAFLGCNKAHEAQQAEKSDSPSLEETLQLKQLTSDFLTLKKELELAHEQIATLRERVIALEIKPKSVNPFTKPEPKQNSQQSPKPSKQELGSLKRALRFLLWEHLAALTLKTKQFVLEGNRVGFETYAKYVQTTLSLLRTLDPHNHKRIQAEQAVLALQKRKITLGKRGQFRRQDAMQQSFPMQ